MVNLFPAALLLCLLSSVTASSLPTETAAPTALQALVPRQAVPTAAPSSVQNGTTTSSTLSIPGTAPAGGLSFTNPPITAAISYYKIMSGNPITFGWNYTGLYSTPKSLTFQAHCSANSYTYPVGPVTGIPGATNQVVWDPYAYLQSPNAVPFAQASYTLRVYDEQGPDATAQPGRFYGANSLVLFALYSPAAYTPLASGWTCVGCSWASSLTSKLNHPLLVALPVTLSLILIGGAGVFNR